MSKLIFNAKKLILSRNVLIAIKDAEEKFGVYGFSIPFGI
jgi:hypothetical protein